MADPSTIANIITAGATALGTAWLIGGQIYRAAFPPTTFNPHIFGTVMADGGSLMLCTVQLYNGTGHPVALTGISAPRGWLVAPKHFVDDGYGLVAGTRIGEFSLGLPLLNLQSHEQGRVYFRECFFLKRPPRTPWHAGRVRLELTITTPRRRTVRYRVNPAVA